MINSKDYFAGMAMQALIIAHADIRDQAVTNEDIAGQEGQPIEKAAFDLAEAMMREGKERHIDMLVARSQRNKEAWPEDGT